jgi:hypothetical protein
MSDSPFKKKGAAKVAPEIHAGEFENATQAAQSLFAAVGTSEHEAIRERVGAWIGSDSERQLALTREFYKLTDKGAVPRR